MHRSALPLVLSLATLFSGPFSLAGDLSLTFQYQGRFFNQSGTEVLREIVNVTFAIYAPDDDSCLLYEEKITGIDLSKTQGLATIQVGSPPGDPKRVAFAQGVPRDPGLPMESIFSNSPVGVINPHPACPTGYTPVPGGTRGRKLRVSVDVPTLGISTTLSPDLEIDFVPFAFSANNLQGKVPSEFIQRDFGNNITQTTVSALTNGSDASALHHHDSQYLKIGEGFDLGSNAFGLGLISSGSEPAVTETGNLWYNSSNNQIQYANGTNYISVIGSATAPTSAGEVVTWDGDSWEPISVSSLVSVSGVAPVSVTGALSSRSISVVGNSNEVLMGASGTGSAFTASPTLSGTVTAQGGLVSEAREALVIKPFGSASGEAGEIRFEEVTGAGGHFVGFRAPDSIADDIMLTLPGADGSPGSVLTTNGLGVLSFSPVSLSSAVNGTLGVANGGTGATSFVSNRILIGSGTSSISQVASGSANQVLISNGASAPGFTSSLTGLSVSSSSLSGSTISGSTLTESILLPNANSSAAAVIRDAAGNSGSLLELQDTSSNVLGSFSQTGTLTLSPQADQKPMIVKGSSSQSVNLTEWQNNAGTAIATMGAAGKLTVPSIAISGGAAANLVLVSDVAGNATWGNVDLSAIASGTLSVANGGTGASSLTANRLLLGNGTSAIAEMSAGNANEVLVSNGAASAPGFSSSLTGLSISSSTLTQPLVVAAADSAPATIIRDAAGNSGNLLEVQNSSSSVLASISSAGVITAQGFSGNLTGNVTGNISGSAASFTGSLAGDVTGTQGSTAVASVGGLAAASVASGAGLANSATASNTASQIVRRDGSGDFSAGVISAGDIQLNAETANRVAYLDGTKLIKSSAVTSTELGYLSGVTSGIQAQLSGKQDSLGYTPANKAGDTFSGNVALNAENADRALFLDGLKRIKSSAVTSTELGYLSGVTSGIQAQLSGKQDSLGYTPANKAGDTFTGNVALSAETADRVLFLNGSKQIKSSGITSTQLGYLSGLTGNIQSQLGGKADLSGPTFSGTISLGSTSGIKLMSGNWADPGNSSLYSGIANDRSSFKKLMIVGNSSAGGSRQVGLWDDVTVSANLTVGSDLTVSNGNSLLLRTSDSRYGEIRHSQPSGNLHIDAYNGGNTYINWYDGDWLHVGSNMNVHGTGTSTFSGSVNINGTGGNVPHGCVTHFDQITSRTAPSNGTLMEDNAVFSARWYTNYSGHLEVYCKNSRLVEDAYAFCYGQEMLTAIQISNESAAFLGCINWSGTRIPPYFYRVRCCYGTTTGNQG